MGSYSDYKANLSSTATAVGIATGTELELSLAKIRHTFFRVDRVNIHQNDRLEKTKNLTDASGSETYAS